MNDVAQAIARVRRTMPRNADVMLICEEYEKLANTARKPTQPLAGKPKRDRAAYMRDVYRPNLRARLAELDARRQAEQRSQKP